MQVNGVSAWDANDPVAIVGKVLYDLVSRFESSEQTIEVAGQHNPPRFLSQSTKEGWACLVCVLAMDVEVHCCVRLREGYKGPTMFAKVIDFEDEKFEFWVVLGFLSRVQGHRVTHVHCGELTVWHVVFGARNCGVRLVGIQKHCCSETDFLQKDNYSAALRCQSCSAKLFVGMAEFLGVHVELENLSADKVLCC